MTGALLHIESLKAWYGASQVLFGVDMQINEGEVVALMGRNGMGKSTTVNAICGMLPRVEGSIVFQDTALIGMPSYEIAQAGVGLVPEGRRIFGNLTTLENLTAAAQHGVWSLEDIYDLFPRLAERPTQSASTLSGGEQQMLAIGRALMTNPKMLILDEATEGLAPVIRQEIWTAIHKLKSEGISILIIDKTLKELLTLADTCYILERGCTVWSGKSGKLSSEIAHQYLGV